MKSWKQKFTYNKKHAIEHEVNGETLRFYPNRIGLLEQLAEISKPIAHAMATLLGNDRSDSTAVTETYKDKARKSIGKDGVVTETADSTVDKITMQAPTPEIAEHRRKERNQAIDELIDGLTNDRNRLMFGALLMDSLRDDFPYAKERSAKDIEEFLFGEENDEIEDDPDAYHGIDLPTLAALVAGWLKANSKVFGATGEKLTGMVRARLGGLQSLSPSAETTSPVDGSSSKTPSSEPSDTDSILASSSSST